MDYLKKNKITLTVIFTLLVLILSIILELVFFTAKYYNYKIKDESDFYRMTNIIEDKDITLKEFITRYDIWKRVFKMWENAINKKQEDFLNLIIIDRDRYELVFSNVVDNLSLKFVQDSFNKSEYWDIRIKDWYLVKKVIVNEKFNNYDLLFVKKLKYNFADYMQDLIWFVLISLIFSIFFYYIWYKFVSRNLRPVEESLNDMNDFIDNAWHELKTPISVINSNLQLIRETKTYEEWLVDEWITEVKRLNSLIESLVDLSNINSSNITEKISINSEIKNAISDFKYKALDKDIKVYFVENYKKELFVNRQYFYILFSNLLWNSIKYNKKWWTVTITLNKNALIIRDSGIWVSSKDKQKIFDRFYMWTCSRNCDWHGIWLSLVKKIADIYKRKIIVNSIEGTWTEFIIKF